MCGICMAPSPLRTPEYLMRPTPNLLLSLALVVLMAAIDPTHSKMVGAPEESHPEAEGNVKAAEFAVHALNTGHELRSSFIGAEGDLQLVKVPLPPPPSTLSMLTIKAHAHILPFSSCNIFKATICHADYACQDPGRGRNQLHPDFISQGRQGN